MKKRELKIAEIKKHNPTLYSKEKSGDLSVQEAHNIVQSEIMNVSEMKGQGTKSNKITLEQEFEIINKRYKPSLDDWIERLKELQLSINYSSNFIREISLDRARESLEEAFTPKIKNILVQQYQKKIDELENE